jgi:hypothetical protein
MICDEDFFAPWREIFSWRFFVAELPKYRTHAKAQRKKILDEAPTRHHGPIDPQITQIYADFFHLARTQTF